jgi:hypothetical protein
MPDGGSEFSNRFFFETVSEVLFKITEVFGAAFSKSCEKAAFFVKKAAPAC